ncbi:MAG: DUF721 domain-containing protein [Candidatus Nitronauta litoralis]|uniref:DUF721 domain-containing protein n=1 Tax=Candidatus Nitronauta litoralis TaxID=2705533 RepID=A0A7T0BUX4_9BACT|nr:MAG: DUF721 domain-containing protein [Candidatus Nitronauta litoralis]
MRSWSPLGKVLVSATDKIPNLRDDELSWIALQWELAVGQDLSAIARVERLTEKTLYVEVAGESWIPALKSLEPRLLVTLNRSFGKDRFTRIRYRENTNFKPKALPAKITKTKIKNSGPQTVNPDGRDIEGLDMIQDSHLKETLARIGRHIKHSASLLALVVLLANCTSMPATQGETSTSGGTEGTSSKAVLQPEINIGQSYAVEKIRKLKEKNPEADLHDPRVYYHYLMGLQNFREARFDKSRDHFAELVKYEPEREEFAQRLVRLSLRTGRLEDARLYATKALERFPKNDNIRMVLADVLAAQGRHQEALNQYGKIFDQDPKNARSKLMMGDLFEKMKRPQEAIEAYRAMTVADTHNPLGFFYLGRALAGDRQFGEAEKELNNALNLRPSLFEARKYLARVMEQQGHYARALEQYKILKKTLPNPEIKKRYEEIEALVVDSNAMENKTLDPLEIKEIPIHALLGAVYYEQAAYLESIDEFRLVLANENDLEIRLIVSKIYEILGRVDQAIIEVEAYRRGAEDQNRVDLLLNLARLYGMDQQMDKSVGLLESALKHEPRNDRLYHSLALAHMALSQYDQAINTIQKAIELDDQKDAYFFELGALYERKGDFQRAVEAMERVIALNPNHSNAHNFIGYLFAMQGLHLDRAIKHLDKALSIQPRNGYFLDSLGWIYFKKGDYNAALEKIKKAMIYVSPDPVLYDHLGDVLFSMKKFSEAHEAWKTSLALTMKKLDDPTGEVPDPSKLKEKLRETREKMKAR